VTEPDEQLRDALRDLIPHYTGPADPLPRVVASVRRRRVRHRALLSAGAAAMAAVAMLSVPAMLAPTTGATTQVGAPQGTAGPPGTPLRTYPVADGVVQGAGWSTGSVAIGPGARRCLSSDDELVTGEVLCFDAWKGEGASWSSTSSAPGSVRATRVFGVTVPAAGAVRVRFTDGITVVADAVSTPTDAAVRFFAVAVEGTHEVRDLTVLTVNGTPAGPAITDPGTDACRPTAYSACAAPK
jgi:hypothetical protein